MNMETHKEHNTEAARATFWEMLQQIRFGMLTTRHANGHLHARPVTMQNRPADCFDSIWLFMSHQGTPVAELLEDCRVNISFADASKSTYVSVSGEAFVVDNDSRKTELWSPFAQAWFPGGATDPDLALVEVKIVHAHYWDSSNNKLVQLYEVAKAALTGAPPKKMGKTGDVLPSIPL